MGYDRIVYIIDGGKYGNGYIAFSKWEGFKRDISWISAGSSCGLHNRTITDIKKKYSRLGKTKFIIVKLPALPKPDQSITKPAIKL